VALAACLVVYLALAVGYSLANPLYESPDELRHVRYVRHIATYRDLPVQRAGGPRAQSHHPPLYYALGALSSCWVHVEQDVYYQPPENPFWAYRYWEVSGDNKNQYVRRPSDRLGVLPVPRFRGITLAVYIMRWMTVLIGAGVVWLTYRIGIRVFQGRRGLALGGAALVAFNPQFLYLSGAVNNDVPAALWGAAVLLQCVHVVEEGPRWRAHVVLGVLVGLALLTKIHLLVLLVPIELAYGLALWQPLAGSRTQPERRRRMWDWRAFLRANLVILGLAALISGWWFARNQVLYGDPLGLSVHSQLWNSRSPAEGWWAIRQELPYLWSSLWGRFGYGQVAMPNRVYQGLLGFSALALAGYLIPRRRRLSPPPLALMLVTVLVFAAWVFYYTLVQPAGARGRFLFPALPAFALLLINGLHRLSPVRMGSTSSPQTGWPASLVTAISMVVLAVSVLVGVLIPAFAPPRPLSPAEIDAIPNPVRVDFGSSPGTTETAVARLLGYQVTPTEITPGDVVEVTLYWEALARTEQNHVVFVHLMSDTRAMMAQRDTYPGLGRYPTTAWDPGAVFADTYRVHVPETAYAPDQGYVQVGMYVFDGPRLTTEGGADALQLARINVRARPGDVPNPMNTNFDDKVGLIGYSLNPRVAQPGETIHLTLYWQALNPMEVNYEVFVHVLGNENQIWANSDSPLTDRAVCTNRWDVGTVVREERELTLAEATPLGFYDLEVGLHAPEGGRLRILAEDGRDLGSRTLLTKVRVVGDE
jgi:4-amino-4-deoxy-L-arabinose transferase-like glycosyltransferase